MSTIQQSIEIRVPVHTAYNQLTQFEDYPQFMEEVKTVQRIDDTHLHWTTTMSNRPVEWDATIVEQQPDRCIAWHNTSGPTNAGRIEVHPAGPDASRVTFTLQAESQQVPGSAAGSSEEEMARRLKLDLARLKDFIEARGSEAGAWRGEAGRETGPVAEPGVAPGMGDVPVSESTQSDYSLSRTSDGSDVDGRFSIAEEVNFDQQSDTARNVGHMPQDTSAEHAGGTSAREAMSQAMTQDSDLKPSMDRAVPPAP
jgi:hypothetical protein